MKQFSAAILMFILLFNLVGYRFIIDYMQKQSDQKEIYHGVEAPPIRYRQAQHCSQGSDVQDAL